MSSFKLPIKNNSSFPEFLSLARAWKNLPGFVFFETSHSHDGMSFLAAEPEKEIYGNDWELLKEELAGRIGNAQKLEEGAAIGFFRYDGSFHFGFYPQVHIFWHSEGSQPASPSPLLLRPSSPFSVSFVPEIEEAHFLRLIDQAQRYIASGEIYQVCLAHRFSGKFEGDFWDYYEMLRVLSPAPYSAFLRLGDAQIASTSPECFLKIQDRLISTQPIKGTRPRHPNPEQDAELAAALWNSEKERSELLMITDLLRNDLGKVCIYGSVKVSELFRLETHPHVFHLVSRVEGTLRDQVSPMQALRACFPGGSITGAPKKRAMEVIAELEPIPRGLYTGAIGYFGYHGESQFNIAIRTAIEQRGEASFHVGAGIVADSHPQAEWQETLHKARGLWLASEVNRKKIYSQASKV